MNKKNQSKKPTLKEINSNKKRKRREEKQYCAETLETNEIFYLGSQQASWAQKKNKD